MNQVQRNSARSRFDIILSVDGGSDAKGEHTSWGICFARWGESRYLGRIPEALPSDLQNLFRERRVTERGLCLALERLYNKVASKPVEIQLTWRRGYVHLQSKAGLYTLHQPDAFWYCVGKTHEAAERQEIELGGISFPDPRVASIWWPGRLPGTYSP